MIERRKGLILTATRCRTARHGGQNARAQHAGIGRWRGLRPGSAKST